MNNHSAGAKFLPPNHDMRANGNHMSHFVAHPSILVHSTVTQLITQRTWGYSQENSSTSEVVTSWIELGCQLVLNTL